MGSTTTYSLPPAVSRLFDKCCSLDLISLYLARRALGVVLFGRFIHRLYVVTTATDGRYQLLPASTFETSVLSVPELVFGLLALALAAGLQHRAVLVGIWLTSLVLFYPDQDGLSYGLTILQCCLFWSMFLPTFALGDRPSSFLSERVVSIASAGFLIQLSLIYHSGGLTKSEGCWLAEGTALYHVLNSSSTADLGQLAFILEYPGLLELASRMVLLFEISAPIFLLSPVLPGVTRSIIAVFMIGMHVGIAATMQIGAFPYICIAIWLTVAPQGWWAWFFSRDAQRTVLPLTQAVVPRRDALLLIPLVFIVVANVTTVVHWTVRPIDHIQAPVRRIGRAARLDQHWIFFNDPCRQVANAELRPGPSRAVGPGRRNP